MAAAGVPMRTLPGWMGHADIKTTLVDVHYAPTEYEDQIADVVFSVVGLTTDIEGQKTE